MLLHRVKKGAVKFFAAAAAAQALALFSCADRLYEDFSVENSLIKDGKAWTVFSAPIDISSAKRNFFFFCDDEQVDGEITVNERFLTFTPREEISENHTYKMQIKSGAKDRRGNFLQADYERIFEKRTDLTKPEVLSIKDLEQGLEIKFNKAIDEISFYDNFSIVPGKEFFSRWNQERTAVEITFAEPFAEGVLHSVKIQADLLDLSNNKMQSDFYWSWTTKAAAPQAQALLYGWRAGQSERIELAETFDGADFERGIEIELTQEVDSETIEGAAAVEPKILFSVTANVGPNGKKCKSALVRFYEKPKWGQEFWLAIESPKIKGRRIAIKNNAEELRPPRLEFMTLEAEGKTLLIDAKSDWANISFPTSAYPAGQAKDFPIRFVYSISGAASRIDRISAMEATSASANSCADISLKTMKSFSQEEFALSAFCSIQEVQEKIQALQSQGKRLCLVECGATFANKLDGSKPARGVIEFKTSKKIHDDKNNFMEEDAIFSCNKN